MTCYWIATTIFLVNLLLRMEEVTTAHGFWPRVIESYLFIPSADANGIIYPILPIGR